MASLGGECAVEEGLPGTPFLLYVGDRRPHKNLKRTVDIFVALKQQRLYDGRLVIAGSRQDFGFNVERYVADRGDVHVLGPISDAALRQLYHRMDALLLLSKYEGFGLPVVEAASHNKRVVVSDGGSLPEIAPSTACVVPNTMPVELAAAQVGAYLSEAVDIDNAPYMQQFTWDAAARAIFGSYLG
jgi:glycosyltransferase involved in cell wall biosynthesis